MFSPRTAVGIDLGHHTITAVELATVSQGVAVKRALKISHRELKKGGVDADDSRRVAAYLRGRMVEAGMPVRDVALGIPNQDCMLRYVRVAPVPSWRLDLIMTYEAGEVAERIGESLASAHRTLSLPRELADDQTVLLALGKEVGMTTLLESFEAEGVTVSRAIPHPLALFAAYDAFGVKPNFESLDDEVVLVADLGAEDLNVALLLNGKLAFARSSTYGGNQFTESLAETLRSSPADAERLKTSCGGLDASQRGVLEDTVAPMRRTASQLLSMLKSTIRMAGSQTGQQLPPLTSLVLSGGGMRLSGLGAFLSQGLKVPVTSFQPAGLVIQDDAQGGITKSFLHSPGDSAVALGLAVSGLRDSSSGEARQTLTLLPGKYQSRRRFREQTVYLYVAAGLLLTLLLARLAFGIFRNHEAGVVLAQNQASHEELSRMQAEHSRDKTLENAARSRLNRMLLEAEQTAFQAFIFDFLGSRLRADIQLERVAIEYDDEQSGAEEYVIQIEGRVSNQKGEALTWIRELQEELSSQERVRAVAIVSADPDPNGAWYRFEIAVRANYARY